METSPKNSRIYAYMYVQHLRIRAGKGFYRATPIVTQAFFFYYLIQRIAPV